MVPWLPVSPLEGLHFDFTPQASRKGASLAGIIMATAAAQPLGCALCKALLSQPQPDVPSLTAPAKEGLGLDHGGAADQQEL